MTRLFALVGLTCVAATPIVHTLMSSPMQRQSSRSILHNA